MEHILLIDDSTVIRNSYKNILSNTDFHCLEASHGLEGIKILKKSFNTIRALVVDQEMPHMNGFQFITYIKKEEELKDIPVIFVSSINNNVFIKDILALGVYDYLTKPIDNDIFLLKVKNAVEARQRELSLKELNLYIIHKNEELENIVKERTAELNDMLFALLNSLENANYYNDNDTGKHARRVAKFSEFIAQKYGLETSIVSHIKLFASIHDIGKVGIDTSIVKKAGKLTPEEYEEVKKHVTFGYLMLKDAPLPEIAKNIIRFHHEKWNGKGYMEGLKGEEIPIESRIVAVGDVLDALMNSRSYKEAFPIEKVIEIFTEERGISFQEELVDIIIENIEELKKINEIS